MASPQFQPFANFLKRRPIHLNFPICGSLDISLRLFCILCFICFFLSGTSQHFLRWALMSQSQHLWFVAGYFYVISCEVSYSAAQALPVVDLSTAHTGSLFDATFELSATYITKDFCLLTPSPYEMAYCRASWKSLNGSTHRFSWTFWVLIFRLNTSCTNV